MRSSLAVASLLCLFLQTTFAADPPEADAPAIDPVGAPAAYTQSVERATYYLWQEDDMWHLRTRTKEKSRPFTGVIRVKGGKVTLLRPEIRAPKVGKKGKVKPPKTPDRGFLSRDGRTITFTFETNGGEDGFDFQVNEAASEIEFHLAVKGFEHPERIVIGKKGVSPTAVKFSLPAHPGNDAAE
ncbi:MAG: hypothetical protein M3552_22065 [Planctomycetota bacterium]|nr:hypothetical protein [Planctomycetaceae bacterium]MDQ3333297.1 hypothetical protein [Planctomycetota bacterium]